MDAAARQIMIVEDNETVVDLLFLQLEMKGYHIAAKVASGEEAVLKASEVRPDLILMDIDLSGQMDGITAARFIFSLFHLPIIFLTGLCDDHLLERAKSAEPYGYLLKPFTEKELISNIEIALHNHSIRKQYLNKSVLGDIDTIMSAKESILVTDLSGRIVFFNPPALRMLESSRNELMMKPSREAISLINEKTGEPIRDMVPEVVRQTLVMINDFHSFLITKSGKRKFVVFNAGPMRDDRGEMIGVILRITEKGAAGSVMPKVK
ncbi:MAG: two-component response regulator [Methanoregula sp. PtaU1.Bin051]|nr:MAG: two-component response regulator [Methanoregula sp. PtaU1.Bin051]